MLAAVLLALAPPQTESLELFRGASVPGTPGYRYWAVEDTYLDPAKPDAGFGGLGKVSAGNGKVMLIKFGDLTRVIGPARRIVSAKLVLSLQAPGKPALKSVSKVMAPWGEGPILTLVKAISQKDDEPATAGAANYKYRRAGKEPASWQISGAKGAQDAQPVQGTKLSAGAEGEVVIEGLGPEVQRMAERWYDNFGLAITFDGTADFLSSQAPVGRPKLVIELGPAQAADGPDLSVTYIEREPAYERYGNEGAYTAKDQDGVAVGVMDKPGGATTKKWPADGEEVTYTAHVKNVGTSPSERFKARWVVQEIAGSGIDLPGLAPGQETTVKMTRPFRLVKDKREIPIQLRIEPTGPDATTANNAVQTWEGALGIGIWVEKSFYEEFSKARGITGSRAFEDWVQEQFRVWNETYFGQSRFSFAPEGVLERTSAQRITIVPDGTLGDGAHLPGGKPTATFDGEWGFEVGKSGLAAARAYIAAVRSRLDPALLHELSHQIGLIDMYTMNVSGEKVGIPSAKGQSSLDQFAGLMGGGDTRSDHMLPPSVAMPAAGDAMSQAISFEATDLYSATDVAALNANLGFRRGFYGEYLYDLPPVVVVKAVSKDGLPLAGVTLDFFQTRGGALKDGAPAFSLTTPGDGQVVLPTRPTGEDQAFSTMTGHTLRPNPFGRIDVTGGNGVFLVRASRGAQEDWAWLKIWQLVDLYHRGNRQVAGIDLKFALAGSVADLTQNVAQARSVSDSEGRPLGTLIRLVDTSLDTEVELPAKAGGWIEIDLARDRTIAEVRLIAKSGAPMWKQFEIQVYASGESPGKEVWAEEKDWAAAAGRREPDVPAPNVAIAYRGRPKWGRFIRIVNTGGGEGKAAEIRVYPARG